MREFDLDLLIGKEVVVNCKTEQEAEEFLKYLDSKNIKWNDNKDIFKPAYYRYGEYKENTCFSLAVNLLQYSPLWFYKDIDYKILSLDDLVTKPKNNFKDYGFEADFEGEILKCFDDKTYIGYVINKCNNPVECHWDNSGNCFVASYSTSSYNLTLIKKEWYENPDNFPCIVLDRNYNMFLAKGIDIDNFLTQEFNKQIGHIKHFRIATKEEVLSLLVKE